LLYSRRKRLAELAAREAAGESFWTDKFDDSVRTKFILAFRYATKGRSDYGSLARNAILHDEGIFFLCVSTMEPADDFDNFVLTCEDEMMPTAVEAMSQACADRFLNAAFANLNAESFDPAVNLILREHRISHELMSHQMVPFSAKELHEAVVAPALCLLAGRTDLENVELACRSALEEISAGKAADAITDAGTALQEMLSSLGCEGNALGPLIASAKTKGLLAPHDSPMLTVVEKVIHWVSADRSEKGDAHAVSTATIDDAWFTVHIVGAVILRLSNSSLRHS
jgi:hypothetical protein